MGEQKNEGRDEKEVMDIEGDKRGNDEAG